MFSCFMAGIFFTLCLQSLSHAYVIPAFVAGLLTIDCLCSAIEQDFWKNWWRKDNKNE